MILLKEDKMNLTPKQLDQQCPVKIDKWVDVYSEACKEIDDNHSITIKWMKIGLEDKFLHTDRDGRLWGKGEADRYYPYHLSYGGQLIGVMKNINKYIIHF
jgi:hypothetical protein